jgi:excisionase family DNA binding protein
MKSKYIARIKKSDIELWDAEEVAKFMGVSKGHIYNLISRGEIPYFKLGRLVRFEKSIVESWVLQQGG